MAIIFFEGFETSGTLTGLANQATTQPEIAKRWGRTQAGGAPSVSGYYLIDDRFGTGFAWNQGSNRGNYLQVFVDDTDVYGGQYTCGMAVHIPDTTEISFTLVSPQGNTTAIPDPHFSVLVEDSTDLTLTDTGFGTIETVPDVFTPGRWYYVEIRLVVHNTEGLVEVKVDGEQVMLQEDIDTQDFYSNVAVLQFGAADLSGTSVTDTGGDYIAFDDIYVDFNESTGDYFLGSRVVVRSLPPDGDNSVSWSTSTGTVHYSLVDENGNDDTDYVESSTNGQRDEFSLTDIPAEDGLFHCVKIEAEASDQGNTDNNLDVEINSGGSRNQTTYQVTESDSEVFVHYQVTDPAGGAWSKTAIDAMLAGIEFNT